MSNLVQGMKICVGRLPTAGAANVNGNGIDCRNAHMVYVVAQLDQDGAGTTDFILQVDDGTDGNWEAITETVPVWVNEDTSADDVLVRDTNAVDYTTAAVAGEKLVVFQVDPAKLGVNGTSDDPNVALRIRVEPSAADDIHSVLYYVVPTRYKSATVPEVRQ